MPNLTNDRLVSASRSLVDAEGRSRAIEAAITRLKQACVGALQLPVPEVVGALDAVAWNLRRLQEGLAAFEQSAGIVRRAARPARPEPAAEPDAALRGSTATLEVSELITLLAGQRKTGTLHLEAATERYVLEFADGAIVHAVSDSGLGTPRLGTILVAQHKLSPQALEDFLADYSREDGRIGEVLARTQLVSREDLRDALESQVQDLFRHVLALEDARFCFVGGALSELETRVCLNATHPLLNAARLADEESLADLVAAAEELAAEVDDLTGSADALDTQPDAPVTGGPAPLAADAGPARTAADDHPGRPADADRARPD